MPADQPATTLSNGCHVLKPPCNSTLVFTSGAYTQDQPMLYIPGESEWQAVCKGWNRLRSQQP